MDNVIQLHKPQKRESVRGMARKILKQASDAVGEPHTVIMITMGENGTFAEHMISDGSMHEVDIFGRAAAMMQIVQQTYLIGPDDDE